MGWFNFNEVFLYTGRRLTRSEADHIGLTCPIDRRMIVAEYLKWKSRSSLDLFSPCLETKFTLPTM